MRVTLYTDSGEYKGWLTANSKNYLEVKSWIESGNHAFCGLFKSDKTSRPVSVKMLFEITFN